MKSKVAVWCRIRPSAQFAHNAIHILPEEKTVNIHYPRDEKQGVVNNQCLDWSFHLDGVLHNSSQDEVYHSCVSRIVNEALNGYSGTVMCYGQTGAGKTFTMTGTTENFHHRGVIPRGIAGLFHSIRERQDLSVSIKISYFEVYNEVINDLLASIPETLAANANAEPAIVVEDENGAYVRGLSYHLVQNEEDAVSLLFEGEASRVIAAHTLNRQSSRSHAVFTVYLECRSRIASDARYTTAKLNFVDLAGSERLAKTLSAGKAREEAMYINKSLSFLEQVVVALAEKHREHVPFRQSKLTHFLKDSIGGKCNTVLVANVRGELDHMEETVSTLRFAVRMMNVSAEPAALEHVDQAAMVRQLQGEVESLRRELAMKDALSNRQPERYEPLTDQQRRELERSVRKYIEGSVESLDIISFRQVETVYELFKKVFKEYEKDNEKRLREIQQQAPRKGQAGGVVAGQPADIAEEMGSSGELDRRSGFGISGAPAGSKAEPNAVANAKKKEAAVAAMKRKSVFQSQSPGPAEQYEHPPSPLTQQPGKKGTPGTGPALGTQPSGPDLHPPNRSEAFEEFKKGRGQEIQRVLSENKEVLVRKKRAYAEIARHVNDLKAEIDKSRGKLEQLKSEREAEGFSMPPSEEGEKEEIVITEDEFVEIRKLHECKQKYRVAYDELSAVRSKITYCQHLIDQCRQRLLREFQQWYADSYGIQLSLVPPSADSEKEERQAGAESGISGDTFVVDEDEADRFERRQRELLIDDPEQYAFSKARQRADHRIAQQTPAAFSVYNQYRKSLPTAPVLVSPGLDHPNHPYMLGAMQAAPSPLPVGMLSPQQPIGSTAALSPTSNKVKKGGTRLPPMPVGG